MHEAEPGPGGDARDYTAELRPSGLPYTLRGARYTAVSLDCPSWIQHNNHVPVLPSARARRSAAAAAARGRPCSAPPARRRHSDVGRSNNKSDHAGASAHAPWTHPHTKSLAPTSPASMAAPSPAEREDFLFAQQHRRRRQKRERRMGFRAWTARNGRVTDSQRVSDIRAARRARSGSGSGARSAGRGHFVPPQRARQEEVAPGSGASRNSGGVGGGSTRGSGAGGAPADVARATQKRLVQLEDEISSVEGLAWHKLRGEWG